jgi:hypothetical protein
MRHILTAAALLSSLLITSSGFSVVSGGIGRVKIDVSDFTHLTYRGKRVYHMTSSQTMAAPLRAALDCLRDKDARHLLHTYEGIINKRNKRNKDEKSMHWWGLAIDINAGRKQPELVVMCFKNEGFVWGGDWSGPSHDPMHFEWRKG